MSPLWRPKLRRRIGSSIHTGQLRVAGDSAMGLSASVVSGAPNRLPVGMWDGFELIGKGPSNIGVGDAVGPIYSLLHGIPATQAALPGILANARAANVHLLLALTHSPGAYSDPGTGACAGKKIFNQSKYTQWLVDAAAFPEVGAALAARRASVLVFDEPLHASWCGSITRKIVNDNGLLTKSLFPGAICVVRASSNVFASTDIPVDGWTGIDYGIAQYGRYPTGSTIPGELPGPYFTRQKQICGASGVGIIGGINLWDGGGSAAECWPYNFPSAALGRIHGSIIDNALPGVQSGDGEPCSTPAVGKYFTSYPALIREVIDVCAADTDIPLFGMWCHTLTQPDPLPTFQALERRQDFRDALDYAITKGNQSTVTHNWRTIK